ncbi:unnamed protein product [Rotaria magnacalcarata]|uniref:EF-hand domain-containing protein n=1 Tax=Rotaria magnacalcarata TaxID=392030 RepID=A0A816SQV8_9BILA|nr:unnamed protein product [Rotaria magnacalcarata]CAF3845111.1 unnamed protein product [Rotaria magnacalcarata]
MAQQTQRNPLFNASIAEFRKSSIRHQQLIVPEKRNVTSFVKLPAVVKNIPTKLLKTIQSAHSRDTFQSHQTSSTVTNHSSLPKLLKTKALKLDVPSINDHVIKHNLTQKAILRCNAPQPQSLLSRSTTFIGLESQEQSKPYHPLQRMDVGSLLTESARNRLKRLFNKLDTDQDGHLSYSQVQRCLPSIFPRAQLTFFHVLYEIISSTTYFGLQEFYATAIIVEIVAKQDSQLWNTLLNDVDFNYYHNSIFELLEDFNNQSACDVGKITYEQLIEFIRKRIVNGKVERISRELENVIPKIKTTKINRLDFIALLPAIIYVESTVNHGRSLFRFQENSLLDSHIRQALRT